MHTTPEPTDHFEKVDHVPIFDLHCDLLTHLCSSADATPFDPASRCSIPQMRAGGVAYQTLAIFGATGEGSSRIGPTQARRFSRLCTEHADDLVALDRTPIDETRSAAAARREPRIRVMAALENASVFCEEDESLDAGLERLRTIERQVGRILYVTLTWHHENRFAGGNSTDVGLKDDGRTLIEVLAERGIALDLSHTSTRTAREAIDFITAKDLPVRILASHSNFAAVFEHERNLADDVARAIVERNGTIGINFLRVFLGADPGAFVEHIRHGLDLGARHALCLGADFFPTEGIPESVRKLWAPDGFFFPEYQDAGCYQDLFALLGADGSLPEDWLPDLAHGNLRRFLA
jgi:microsomal dipeptidase-like Zn-dependent dipeptidase